MQYVKLFLIISTKPLMKYFSISKVSFLFYLFIMIVFRTIFVDKLGVILSWIKLLALQYPPCLLRDD